MAAKLVKLNNIEFLHISPSQDDDQEYSILERISGSARPQALPAGITLVEQHTYRHALWSSVITLQVYKDDRWNEFRVRNIKNGDEATAVDVLYRNRKLDDIIAHLNRTVQQETTI